ncbi:MAG: CRISPR-associated endonuclease Cas2 [Candidatus Sericytochromatia bacterium]
MAKSKRWYLFCYDIREPRRLQQVAKVLESYGHRLQYSIFRCHLTPRELERLTWQLTKVTEKEDSVISVGLCSGCVQQLKSRHPTEEWAEPETPHFEII